MLFLFDNEQGESELIECADWDAAEALAEAKNFTLLGEFQKWVEIEGKSRVLYKQRT